MGENQLNPQCGQCTAKKEKDEGAESEKDSKRQRHLHSFFMAQGQRVLNEKVAFQDVPFDVYRGLGFPGADDMGNMFQYQQLLGPDFLRARDPELSRHLNPELLTFDEWLRANAGRIPRE